jgi:hypothetical protein
VPLLTPAQLVVQAGFLLVLAGCCAQFLWWWFVVVHPLGSAWTAADAILTYIACYELWQSLYSMAIGLRSRRPQRVDIARLPRPPHALGSHPSGAAGDADVGISSASSVTLASMASGGELGSLLPLSPTATTTPRPHPSVSVAAFVGFEEAEEAGHSGDESDARSDAPEPASPVVAPIASAADVASASAPPAAAAIASPATVARSVLARSAPRINPLELRVAMVVTKAPSEPVAMLQATLGACLAQEWPVRFDVWLADKDPVPDMAAWCAAHGVRVSCHKGVPGYLNPEWPRRRRCKEGNLAYFYDKYGYAAYDVVCQFDGAWRGADAKVPRRRVSWSVHSWSTTLGD